MTLIRLGDYNHVVLSFCLVYCSGLRASTAVCVWRETSGHSHWAALRGPVWGTREGTAQDQKTFQQLELRCHSNNLVCIINRTKVTLFWKVKSAPLEPEFVIRIWLVFLCCNYNIPTSACHLYYTVSKSSLNVKQEPKWKGNTSQMWVFLWPSHWS